MKSTISSVQQEVDQKRQAYENAKRVRKHAKIALKSAKQTHRQALEAEKDAKRAYKAMQRILEELEPVVESQQETTAYAPAATAAPTVVAEEPVAEMAKTKAPAAEKPMAKKTPAKPAAKSGGGGDDLTRVKGVGDRVAAMLQKNGIRSFADMAALSIEQYKDLLKANGMSQFRNPTTWAADAAILAESGAGKTADKPTAATARTTQSSAPVQPEKTTKKQAPAKSASSTKPAKEKTPAKPATPKKAIAKTAGDDLTMVTGVGDRVADMLQRNGIRSFSDMAALSVDQYKNLLKANGMSQFRNPTNWASEAALLAQASPKSTPAKAKKSVPGKRRTAEKSTKPAKSKTGGKA